MSVHNSLPWNQEFRNDTHVIGIMFAGQKPDKSPDIVFLAVNAHWEQQPMQLPDLPDGLYWSVKFYTNVPHISEQDYSAFIHRNGNQFYLSARSVMILIAKK